MRVEIDPMPALRADAIERVNARFSIETARAQFKEGVYARKRAIAQSILDGNRLPDDHPFVAEGALRGLSQEEFAILIADKPDASAESDAREMCRQRLLMAISAAKSPAEIDEIFADIERRRAPDEAPNMGRVVLNDRA